MNQSPGANADFPNTEPQPLEPPPPAVPDVPLDVEPQDGDAGDTEGRGR